MDTCTRNIVWWFRAFTSVFRLARQDWLSDVAMTRSRNGQAKVVHRVHLSSLQLDERKYAFAPLSSPDSVNMSNFVDVSSPEHFKELLSADLKRVSCLNFWAPWAEPCEAFTQAVKEQATKFPQVLFLNVSGLVRVLAPERRQGYVMEGDIAI